MNKAYRIQQKLFQVISLSGYSVVERYFEGLSFPFFRISERSQLRDDSKTDDISVFTFQVSAFSKRDSSVEVKELMDFVISSVLDISDIEEYSLDKVVLSNSIVLYDEEEEAYHGVMQFDFQVS